MKRYHTDVYFPIGLDFATFWRNLPELTYSLHFKQRLFKRHRENIPQINKAMARRGEIFEAYAEGNKVVKVGLRIRVSKMKWNIYVITDGGYVVTAWTMYNKFPFLYKLNRSLYEGGS